MSFQDRGGKGGLASLGTQVLPLDHYQLGGHNNYTLHTKTADCCEQDWDQKASLFSCVILSNKPTLGPHTKPNGESSLTLLHPD